MERKLILLTNCLIVLLLTIHENAAHIYFKCGPEQLCYCHNHTRMMDCSMIYLKTFHVDPAQNWSWVEYLDLAQNSLTSVPHLKMFTHLTSLSLYGNHNISTLEENSFAGLENLRTLDLTQLSLTFRKGTVHPRMLAPLKRLADLRIKTVVKPDTNDDYSFILPVKETLEELLIIGTPKLAELFEENFPRLQSLSIGGAYCRLTEITNNGLNNLKKLPLKRLSIRGCNISTVPVDYFRPLAQSLLKIDLSCNPIHEALMNITRGLKGGILKTLVGDYINHKPRDCGWDPTSESILPSLEVVSLQGNQINNFTVIGNTTSFMASLKYFDIGYNPLNGAVFNILTAYCTEWFWCNKARPHHLQYFGINGISRPDTMCGSRPEELACQWDSALFTHESLTYEHIPQPHQVDVFIWKGFFDQLNATAETDAAVLFNNSFNVSVLPADSIVGIFALVIEGHPEVQTIYTDIVDIINKAPSKYDKFRMLAGYFCRSSRISIYEVTMKKWVRFNTTGSDAWTDSALSVAIEGMCKQADWDYGLKFFTGDKHFHWIFTNLTTVLTNNNVGLRDVLSKPNDYCNDVVYFKNNLVQIDFSFSDIPYIACSNLSGFDTVREISCRSCNNHRGWNFTGADFPNLYKLKWSGNPIGTLIRESNLFRGFTNLRLIGLSNLVSPIKYFKKSEVFADQRHLSELLLDNSGIEVWNISLVNNTNIKNLYLRKNSIKYIEEQFRTDLELAYNTSKLQIFFAGNPIECSCNPENLKFVQWLNSAKVIYDKKKLRCGMSGAQPVSSFPKQQQCARPDSEWPTWQILVVVSATLVVVLVAAGFIMRRVIRRRRRAVYERLADDTLPTAFISFPHRMTDDITAMKELTKDRLALLSSVWDFLDGDVISHNLSALIADTKKFILVISQDYFYEDSTAKEFHLLEQAGLLKRDKVVLIFTSADNISKKLPAELQEMYNDGDFLIWPTCVCGSTELVEMSHQIIRKVMK